MTFISCRKRSWPIRREVHEQRSSSAFLLPLFRLTMPLPTRRPTGMRVRMGDGRRGQFEGMRWRAPWRTLALGIRVRDRRITRRAKTGRGQDYRGGEEVV